jgi:chromosome partitioning protein
VTDSSDDLSARGRAIFERLRGEGRTDDAPAPSAEADGALAADPDLAETAAAWAPLAPEGVDGAVPDVGRPDEIASIDDAMPADAMLAEPSAPPTGVGPGQASLPGAVDLPAPDALAPADPAASAAPVADDAASPDVDADAPSDEEADPAADPSPALGSFARPLPRVMAVANQKGGVGKTTTAVNLGACLADIGYRVLVVDLDPQGNASTGLGINIRDLSGSMYDVILHDMPIEDCVEPTSVRNLFCAPSSLDLAGAEIELVPAFSREQRLKRALEEVRDDYDFVLIDCPPSLGLLTVNGLAAATEVVVPIQCEYYALEGLGQLLRNVNLVQKNLNPVLEVSAIVLVMYDARTKLADQVVSEVREHFGAKVCRNVIPRTVRLSEAPSFGQPIIAFDSSSRGAIAYRELAKEVSGGTPQRAG